jgi:glutamate formiminotransferase
MPGLVESVPNFSEGRRLDVVERLADAVTSTAGVHLLDRTSDASHNRSVLTIAGEAGPVQDAVERAIAVAVHEIDMEAHWGEHPRIGAVDVIPFVPLRRISMDEVVELARAFAEQLADELDLPVYVYDRAAMSPERTNLADVRRGEYEGLRAAVARGERLPDFGPHRIGNAGATAVGARKPLIAFNMYLSGPVDGAKEIANAIRESSGGLPAVRAIGFETPERGGVTVSMNLVDFEVTGIRTAFDAVTRLAAERDMPVLSSEIVGLVPEAALVIGDAEHMRLEGFDAETQILERLMSGDTTQERAVG